MAEPISFTQGETVVFTVTITDTDGNPVDISADTMEAQIRSVNDLTVSLGDFTSSFVDPTYPNTIVNKAKFTLDSESSAAIVANMEYDAKGSVKSAPVEVYIYDVFRSVDNGVDPPIRKKVAGGLVSVYPAATVPAV